ncbi:hypothetical protein M9H77_26927 [Catharanthus roseus]|uniref:Uncharacterized protein n=1 Tax=Catharanthus roseus TaxID=4058 RepID=A0ACC0ABF8_CATRO|nr:hypothetical protein M9H77_26927 [Catharanthus roseus]
MVGLALPSTAGCASKDDYSQGCLGLKKEEQSRLPSKREKTVKNRADGIKEEDLLLEVGQPTIDGRFDDHMRSQRTLSVTRKSLGRTLQQTVGLDLPSTIFCNLILGDQELKSNSKISSFNWRLNRRARETE